MSREGRTEAPNETKPGSVYPRREGCDEGDGEDEVVLRAQKAFGVFEGTLWMVD